MKNNNTLNGIPSRRTASLLYSIQYLDTKPRSMLSSEFGILLQSDHRHNHDRREARPKTYLRAENQCVKDSESGEQRRRSQDPVVWTNGRYVRRYETAGYTGYNTQYHTDIPLRNTVMKYLDYLLESIRSIHISIVLASLPFSIIHLQSEPIRKM